MEIRSNQGLYFVYFRQTIDEIVASFPQTQSEAAKVVVLIDKNVADNYIWALEHYFTTNSCLVFEAKEEEKTWEGASRVLQFLQEQKANRQTILVAIGGGIVQDVAAFATGIYFRGIPWVYVPTTLLAQCDSCIGAKSGLNFGEAKNQLGLFNAPKTILLSTKFTDTLSDLEIQSGYGEILKLAVTASKHHFIRVCEMVREHGLRGPHLAELVRGSLEIKKPFIEEDEFDRGRRRLLNYGHTFGHSLESATQYEVPHGLAVAFGMDLVNFLAWKRGVLSEADFHDIHSGLREVLPFRKALKLSARTLVEGTRSDKKNSGNGLTLVVPEAPGKLKTIQVKFDDELLSQVESYLTDFQVFA